MTASIPNKDRPEWKMMITQQINHNYSNYVLQLRVFQLNKSVTSGNISIDLAVNELYELCQKYSKAVQSDFKQIFKNW